MTTRFTISHLGHSGDGVAAAADGPVYIPFTLPGEVAVVERSGNRAAMTSLLTPSADRVAPPCSHFGDCGGCALQHWGTSAYSAWKRERVVAAFSQRGIDAPVADLVTCPPASRRRAVFTAERRIREIVIGFNRAGSHDLTAITECHVLVPAIIERLPAIATLIGPLVPQRGRVRVTVIAADNGLDIAIDGLKRVDAKTFDAISARVNDAAIARITVEGELAYRDREPEIAAGNAVLLPTPGGFIQAVAASENAMVDSVLAGVGNARIIVDLFAGIGTFSLRMAAAARVRAVENDAVALAALARSARRMKGLKPIETVRRDLFDAPLTPRELKGIDAVLFDPPRAGARAQAEQLAVSAVPRVVAVSCNPATLARDARILIDGGYRLTGVTPIDQFLWSAHVEAVATFELQR